MPLSVVVGSGPAAAGVALALAARTDQSITVLDLGGRLDAQRQQVIDQIALLSPSEWTSAQIEEVSQQAVSTASGTLPEKRAYGSDFPFADLGQRRGITALGEENISVVSGAYGGFSNVWGSQVMPFSPQTLDRWPISYAELEPHYRAILEHIPFAGEHDDLAEHFPLITEPRPLPALSPRTAMVMNAYRRHRSEVRSSGVIVGHARLAFAADHCVRCGLCMTGCPYSLIYSASQTFDSLRRAGRIDYHDGLLVYHVREDEAGVVASALRTATGERVEFRADRLYLACGGIGSTRVVLNSLGKVHAHATLGESVQFALPLVSLAPTPDPRTQPSFTLNQFNVVVDLDERGVEVSQLHCYPYNPAVLQALPRPLRASLVQPATSQLLRRLSIALGYLPSWASPPLRIELDAPSDSGLGKLTISQVKGGDRPPMLDEVVRRLRRSARFLDLWPLKSAMLVSAGAKSYHFGGSFPHARPGEEGDTGTDRFGRLARWRRIHLVDGAVFPTVPATTFTLTVMANAHRIASQSLALADG